MTNIIDFLNDNKIKFDRDVSIKTLTTYKCGGNAKYVVYPKTIDEIKTLIKYLKDFSVPFKIFGNGSNILASDRDYNGVIIKLTYFNSLKIDGNDIYVGAGYSYSKLANKLSNMGYTGLEFACGIPATVGGAVYMNAGAYLKDTSSVIYSITCLDDKNNVITLLNNECKFTYRNSILKEKNFICLEAHFKLSLGNIKEIKDLISDRMKRRLLAQPLDYYSAGSVFRNPENNYAGRLIEDSGLKGFIKGDAEISAKHANFIINKGNASADDVKYLMDKAHDIVKENYNIDLYREQELFNWE